MIEYLPCLLYDLHILNNMANMMGVGAIIKYMIQYIDI